MQKLRLALKTLNVPQVKTLVDYLEMKDNRGLLNGRFGGYGIQKLAELPLDSPLWNELKGPFKTGDSKFFYSYVPPKRNFIPLRITKKYRPMIKAMARRILDDKNYASLMKDVHGGDWIFEKGDLSAWLSKHRRDGKEPDSKTFQNFYSSVETLNRNGVGMMEWLEWKNNSSTIPDNKRYGMKGVRLLSQLTPKSTQWKASGNGHLDSNARKGLIDAAKVLVSNDNLLWAFQVHHGDQIFEPDDMKKWLDANKV
jgi:hypothetical protein